MKFIPLRRKSGIVSNGVQVQSTLLRQRFIILLAAFAALSAFQQEQAVAQESGVSTSPLQILQQAPRVRFDDPEPTSRPAVTPQSLATATPYQRDPVPYQPPAGPAPYVEPVHPAITPYVGNPVNERVLPPEEPYYRPPAPGLTPAAPGSTPPLYVPPSPTGRPVLGPEDVEPRKKRGFMRGLINAIPFVGNDDDDDEKQTPQITPAPLDSDTETPTYRGYDPTPSSGTTGEPILMPPGASSPIREENQREPESTSPPIMTPEPRYPTATDRNDVTPATDLDTAPRAGAGTAGTRPVLTVKRESDNTTRTEVPTAPLVEPAEPGALDEEAKQPALSPDDTPRPLERATTSVIIQESRPAEEFDPASSDDTLGPQPDPSATRLQPFDPARPTPVSDAADIATSLTIVQADLGMPNPTYEPNSVVLVEFQEAVRKARIEDYETAARLFREYGQNHPSSGLAPRAYFLSIIFEKDRDQARSNFDSMKRLFPESRYIKEAESRRDDVFATSTIAGTGTAIPNETPRQKVDRLERELTVAVGDASREPQLRKDLGLAYIELEEYDRAYEVLRPALDMSAGHPAEAEILLAMGRILVVRRQTVQAISLFEAVEDKEPELIYKDAPSAWNVGLAFEGIGRYNKARAIYNTIRQKWPETVEAGWATTRLTELAALSQ